MSAMVQADDGPMGQVVLGIHGGTSSARGKRTDAEVQQMRDVLSAALAAGKARLDSGGTSLDAVETAIRHMEDSPLLNAGKGSVFTRDGRNELDASIMTGNSRRAGAVAGVTTIKNPITAARAVMEKSPHVLLVGSGAEVFASAQKLEIVDPTYFWTQTRWDELQKYLEEERINLPSGATSQSRVPHKDGPFGTVGAVALDKAGNLAAGTSTGGLVGKAFGRIGDSPIIGAGTYADNRTAAVSCTGQGEYFIRLAVAHEIVSLMRLKGEPIDRAVRQVIREDLSQLGGKGAAIALDRDGQFVSCRNTPGLLRGWITRGGEMTVRLYDE